MFPERKIFTERKVMKMPEIDKGVFAEEYARGGNIFEAAVAAGAPRGTARIAGLKLICDRTVRRRIEQHRLNAAEAPAIQGLRRIAFGRNNDAAALAFAETVTPEMVARADLYGVSEIKCGKGVVEIKFFDRCKALDMLREAEGELSREGSAESFLNAVFGGEEARDVGKNGG